MSSLCGTCEGLPTLAAVVVLASALVHATWNVLLSRVPRGRDTTAVGLALGFLAWTPVALARWRVEAAAWPYAIGSAALELAYFAALNLAYARAPAHASYPVARGLAPVLLLGPVAVVSGPTYAWFGVTAIGAGVMLTAWGQADRRALGYAVPVAFCIAGYTFLDSYGVRHADPATYLWLVMAPVVAVLLFQRRRSPLRSQLRGSTVLFGLGVYIAYGLTLVALNLAGPALVPAVAALRETSILFVIALSWFTAFRHARWRNNHIVADPDGPESRNNHVVADSDGSNSEKNNVLAPSAVGVIGAVLIFGGVVALTLS